jgi:putative flippase GtrA
MGVMTFERSKRTRILFWLYSAVVAVAVALMLWLFAVLGTYYVAGEILPHPPLVRWMVIALVPVIVLRFALRWSIERDQR